MSGDGKTGMRVTPHQLNDFVMTGARAPLALPRGAA
jgi:hypothetical protein